MLFKTYYLAVVLLTFAVSALPIDDLEARGNPVTKVKEVVKKAENVLAGKKPNGEPKPDKIKILKKAPAGWTIDTRSYDNDKELELQLRDLEEEMLARVFDEDLELQERGNSMSKAKEVVKKAKNVLDGKKPNGEPKPDKIKILKKAPAGWTIDTRSIEGDEDLEARAGFGAIAKLAVKAKATANKAVKAVQGKKSDGTPKTKYDKVKIVKKKPAGWTIDTRSVEDEEDLEARAGFGAVAKLAVKAKTAANKAVKAVQGKKVDGTPKTKYDKVKIVKKAPAGWTIDTRSLEGADEFEVDLD